MAGIYANTTTWAADFAALIGGSPTYTAVGDIVSIDFSGMTADTLDVSVHGSTWREYVPGLKDGGTITITARFGPETHATLLDNVGTKSAHRFTFPKETSTNAVALQIEWNAIVSSVGLAAPHDGLLEASVTLQTSGAPTITDEALA